MTAPKSRSKDKRGYRRHGFTEAKAAIQRWGERSIHEALDGRTRTGRALIAWRDALVEDLGGLEVVSAMQLQLVELACRQKLLLDSIDGWLLQQDSLVNKRDRKLFNVVKERQTVANALASYLGQLGLERVAPVIDADDLYVVEDDEGDE